LVLGQTTGNSDSQDSTRPRLGGSHHLPPYSISCNSPWGPHPNGFLPWDSHLGVPKIPHMGFLRLWRRITWRADLRLQWDLKQSFSLRQELSNSMFHVACTQEYWVDSQLLVVGSEIANLTPDLLLAITCVSYVQMGDASPF
jgi:hypothetical protein